MSRLHNSRKLIMSDISRGPPKQTSFKKKKKNYVCHWNEKPPSDRSPNITPDIYPPEHSSAVSVVMTNGQGKSSEPKGLQIQNFNPIFYRYFSLSHCLT